MDLPGGCPKKLGYNFRSTIYSIPFEIPRPISALFLNYKNATAISETLFDQLAFEIKTKKVEIMSINSIASCGVIMITHKSSRRVSQKKLV